MDLLIGAVLVPGAAAPKLITREMVKTMKTVRHCRHRNRPRGLFGDVTPTTHSHPTYVDEGVVHYCVTNMPGAVARTSTFALNNVTLPFTLLLADKGWKQALRDDPHLRNGLNVHDGRSTAGRLQKRTVSPWPNIDESIFLGDITRSAALNPTTTGPAAVREAGEGQTLSGEC